MIKDRYVLFAIILIYIASTSFYFADFFRNLGFVYLSLLAIITLLYSYRNTKLSICYILFIIYFAFHLSYTTDRVISCLMYVSCYILSLNMNIVQIKTKQIFYFIIGAALFNIIFDMSGFIVALTKLDIQYAFLGVTRNTNTTSLYGALAFISCVYLYLLSAKGRIWIFLFLFFIFMVACMSRNTILFIVYSLLLFICLRNYNEKKYDKFAIVSTSCMLVLCYVFLIYIYQDSDINLFNKGAGSSSRTAMTIFSLENFNFSFFGLGREYISSVIHFNFSNALHNAYVFTFYSFGIFYVIFYICFITSYYKNLKYKISKSFTLGIHIYYFFEPIIFFEYVIPTYVLLFCIYAGDRLLINKFNRN